MEVGAQSTVSSWDKKETKDQLHFLRTVVLREATTNASEMVLYIWQQCESVEGGVVWDAALLLAHFLSQYSWKRVVRWLPCLGGFQCSQCFTVYVT